MSKQHCIYTVQYERDGKNYVLFLRTLTACVATLKSLCERPYSRFRAYRHTFDDSDVLHFRETDECTERILSIVDKLFPLKRH